jgi:hypothetical protein
MLTIFSAPKPFSSRAGDAQRNALDSWTRLAPDVQVILFGDEAGIGEAAAAAGAEHEPNVARNDFGTPLLDDVFMKAQARARHARVCYVNADILFLADFAEAVRRLSLDRFLAVGRRTDLDVPERLAFGAGWQEELRARARGAGRLHEPTGIDFFLFPRGQLAQMPPFPVGRILWDNWMIHDARTRRIPVVDLTDAALVVHQNHDYGHVAGGQNTVWRGVEAQRNWERLGPDFFPLTIADATWTLDARGLHPAHDLRHLVRRALVYPALSPTLRPSVRVARYLRQRVVAIAQRRK